MPWDFETQVCINADEVLDYVRDNKDWFLSQLGCDDNTIGNTLASLDKYVSDLMNKYDDIRRYRDESSNNRNDRAVKLYEELAGLKNKIRGMMAEI